MKLLFTPEALSSFNELKTSNSREADKVKDTIKEILSNPSSGKGNPTPLYGSLSGLWRRDYAIFRQIVYSFTDEEVKIYSIGKNILTDNETHSEVQQTDYTETEYRNVLAQMEANRQSAPLPSTPSTGTSASLGDN